MEAKSDKDPMVLAVFAQRRRWRLISMAIMLAFVILIAVGEGRPEGTTWGMRSDYMAWVMFVPVLAYLLVNFRLWRCPACNRMLGKSYNPRYCNNCGTALRD